METRPSHSTAAHALVDEVDDRLEELVNWLTHGFGLVLALGGFFVLVAMADAKASPTMFAAVCIYGISLIVLYLASTLYHWVRSPKLKRAFKIFDHAAIFGLIAGTWTPFALGPLLETGHGWWMFALIWAIAFVGIGFKLFFTGRFRLLSTGAYLGMGFLGLLVIVPMASVMSTASLLWLIGGGVAYTVGVIFYLWDRLRWGHGIWHGFVMAGSASHFIAVLSLMG